MKFRENPFASRKAVQTVTNFRGRSEILEVIVRRLSDNINLFGEPRIGRTSLLSFLVSENGARCLPEFGEILKEYLFVFLDLQMVRNETDFWRALIDGLDESRDYLHSRRNSAEALEDIPLQRAKPSPADTYELVRTFESLIKTSSERIVVVFDNFDLITEFDKDETLQVTDKLRAISQNLNRRISYLVGSVDSVNVLFEERNLIQRMSPFPSIFEYHVPLGLLEIPAVREIVRGSQTDAANTASTPDSENQDWLKSNEKQIIKLAGRHPDLLKRVCFHFDEAFSDGITDVERIKENVKADAHVKFLFDLLVRRCRQKEKRINRPFWKVLKQVAAGEKPVSNNILEEFSDLGLFEVENNRIRIFSELFRDYLVNNTQFEDKNASEQNARNTVDSKFDESSLTPRESRLYNFLSEHRNELCSRQDLKKAICGEAPPSGDADLALEQIVKRLRQKIEDDEKNPQKLLTVRGKGYLLKE